MKKYIKPSIKVKRIELGNSILAGSIGVGIDDDPATGPALSKGSFFSDDKKEGGNSDRSSSSLWED